MKTILNRTILNKDKEVKQKTEAGHAYPFPAS